MAKNYQAFAQKLHNHLEHRDFTRAWLERQVGASVGSISRWISYETRPGGPEVIVKIAAVLELSDLECKELVEAAGYLIKNDYIAPEPKPRHNQKEPQQSEPSTLETELHLKEIKAGVASVKQNIEQIDNKITTFAQDAEAHSMLLVESLAAHAHQSKFQPPQQDLQLPITRPFVGREEIMFQVAEQLQPGNAVTLWGAGGQGKTSIAWKVLSKLRMSEELIKRFPDGTILHNFAAQPDLEAALTHIAKSLDEKSDENPIGACLRALSGKRALLIFESTEEADEETLRTLYALGNECGLLITTRRQTDAPDKNFLHPIGQLPLHEATTMLETIVNTHDNVSSNSARLCKLIDSQPLAVRVAASYLIESGETIQEYVDWLEEDAVGALSSNSVMERMLKRTINQIPEDACILLALIASLAAAPFHEDIVISVLSWNRTQYKRTRKRLLDYGLLRQVGDKQLQITHALIYQYARALSEYQRQHLDQLGAYYIQMIEKMETDEQIRAEGTDIGHTHILAVLKKCEELQQWNIAKRLFLTTAVGKDSYFGKYALPKQHITAFQIGLAATRALGEEHDEEIRIAQLGRLYLYHGQLEESVIYLEQALGFAKKNQNQDEEISHLSHLGHAYTSISKEKAIDRYKQVLTLRQEPENRVIAMNCLIKLGEIYFHLDQANVAVGHYENAISIARETGDHTRELNFLTSLGNWYLHLGQHELAIATYETKINIARAASNKQATIEALQSIGKLYAFTKRFEKALDNYNQAYALAKSNEDKIEICKCLNLLGDLYLGNNHIEKALENYEQSDIIDAEITLPAITIQKLLQLSDLCFQQGRFDQGEHYQKKAQKIVLKMKQEWTASTGFRERSAIKEEEASATLKIIYQMSGVNTFAEPIYIFVMLPYKLYISLKTMVARGFIFDPRNYGEIVLASKDKPDARIKLAVGEIYNITPMHEAATEVLQQNPKSAEDFRNRGSVYLSEKNYNAAQSDLEIAIQLNPADAASYAHYGHLLYQLNQYQKSCEYYDQAVELDSETALHFLGRGKSWVELNQFTKANADFERAVILKPDDAWYHNWLGQSLAQLREWKLALNAFNRAIQLLPWESYFFRVRSKVHIEQMNYAKARLDLETAIELAPEDAWNCDALAYLELTQSHYQSALYPAQQAIELNPKEDIFHFRYGLACLGTGQLEVALTSMERSFVNTTDLFDSAFTKFWVGVVAILQNQLQKADVKWNEVQAIIPELQDESQKTRILALIAFFDQNTNPYAFFDKVLNAKYGYLSTQLLYLRLLAHLFPQRNNIQVVARWFEEQISERFGKV